MPQENASLLSELTAKSGFAAMPPTEKAVNHRLRKTDEGEPQNADPWPARREPERSTGRRVVTPLNAKGIRHIKASGHDDSQEK